MLDSTGGNIIICEAICKLEIPGKINSHRK
jgi:hypothetical protein